MSARACPRSWSLRALLAVVLLGALVACGGGTAAKKVDTDGDGRPDTPASAVQSPTVGATPPAPDPRFGLARVGQCTRMTPQQSRGAVAVAPTVACGRAHTSVVAYAALVPRPLTTRTPFGRRQAVARRVCEPAFVRAAGGTPDLRASSVLTWTFHTPTPDQLARGARWVRCDVVARSGEDLVPLPDARPLLRPGLVEELRVCQTRSGADVSCARRHAFRLQAVFRPEGTAYPGPAYTATARARCAQLTGQPTDGATGFWQPPSRAGWSTGDRFVRCLARTG